MNVEARKAAIVVTMDSARVETAELDVLARLAGRMDAAMEAVFIEDSDLLRLNALAFLHEFRPSSMRVEPLHRDRMQSELHVLADRARRHVADFADQRGLQVPFRVWRGSVSRELLGAFPTDVLALLRVGAVDARPARRSGRDALAVLFDGRPAAVRALRVAAGLAAEHPHGRLDVILGGDAATDVGILRRMAVDSLAGGPLPRLEFHVSAQPQPASLSLVLEQLGSHALVLGRDSMLLAPRSIRAHLARANCATLLVR